jgi:glutathione S-transferase
MASPQEPEIILYDLACEKHVCFSLFTWRTRLMLNYKGIPYKTVFLKFHEIEPTLKSFGIPPQPPGSDTSYTVPTIHIPSTGKYLMDSFAIYDFLEKQYPQPPVPPVEGKAQEVKQKCLKPFTVVSQASIVGRVINIISPDAQPFFRKSREADFGRK